MTALRSRDWVRNLRAKMVKIKHAVSPTVVSFHGNTSRKTKWALLSYLPSAINLRDGSPRMLGHSNIWECREVARILSELGYNVEAIHCSDTATIPIRKYDLVIDVARNVQRLAPFQKRSTKYMLLLTGSHHLWSIQEELRRVLAFERTHDVYYVPRYGDLPLYALDKSLRIADAAMLIGNDVTLKTYPEEARKKIVKIPVTASVIDFEKKYTRRTNEFLYYAGPRNVVKGLDLCLDLFLARPEWKLHVVGGQEREMDFMRGYPTIDKAKNIVFHGFMKPSSSQFLHLLDRCDAFLAPSCSDGTATAVLTTLSAGLYPILSAHTGVDLPEGCGIWISELTVQSLESAIRQFLDKSLENIAKESSAARSFTLGKHSRAAFTEAVRRCIASVSGTALPDAPPLPRDPLPPRPNLSTI